MQTIHITANSRLSAAIKEKALLSSGNRVIETPMVMTLGQWWQLWQTSALLSGELAADVLPKKVLNAFEAQWLWEQLLQDVLDKRLQADSNHSENDDSIQAESIALLNVHTTAKQLYQAWLLCAEWLPEDWQNDSIISDETHLFKEVLQLYLKHLETKDWQDDALLSKQRLAWLFNDGIGKKQLPERFCLHGFDDLSPNIKQWQTAVEALGCVVENDTKAVNKNVQLPVNSLSCYGAQDLFDEVQQVANWAIQTLANQLENKPFEQVKIAIVAPNVAEYKAALSQCLDEQLYLNGLANLASQTVKNNPQAKLYNLSLGEYLSDVPLIENAWQTLNLFLQPDKSTH